MGFHEIPELLGTLQLLLLQPLLHQLLPALLQHWPAQLQRLVLVQLALPSTESCQCRVQGVIKGKCT